MGQEAAYVFAYENGSWGQQARLTADTGASGDRFGFGVGLSGSYAVIGAPQDDDAGSNAGSAYTFAASGGGGSSLQTTTIVYEYDPLYRLTSANYTGTLSGAYSYSYDAAGNRLSFSTNVTNTQTVTYTYDAANQLIMATDNGQTWYYEYAGNGNQIRQIPNGLTPTDGEIRYTFNQRNQLVLMETHNGSNYQSEASAVYDGDGNRRQTTVFISGTAVTTSYTVDVQQYGRPLVQHNAAITDTCLIPGLGEYQDSWRYYLMDGQTSVRQLIDNNRTLLLSRTYDPFGSILISTGTADTLFGFVSAQEGALGLLYWHGRYYDPANGRYLSPRYNFDPMRPGTLNGYLASLLLANPGGLFFGPLLLVGWRRRKKNGKYPPIWLLIAGVSLGVLLSSCQGSPGTLSPGTPPPAQPANPTASPNPALPPTQPPTAPPIGPPPSPTPIPTTQLGPTATPTRIIQVNLNTHPKVSQYNTSVVEEFGYNACGLVAATAPFVSPGDPAYIQVMESIINNAPAGAYGAAKGIQPSAYVQGLKGVYGSSNVTEHNNWNIDGLFNTLVRGEIVIVDIRVQKGSEIPGATPPNFAHFARVLGLDIAVNEIYIENTLTGYSYWTVDLNKFNNEIWVYPETQVSLKPDPNPEPVTKWAVSILPGAKPVN